MISEVIKNKITCKVISVRRERRISHETGERGEARLHNEQHQLHESGDCRQANYGRGV